MSKSQITLNSEQAIAIESLLEYIQNPDPFCNWYFTLKGFAGTGKTFCMQEVLTRCSGSKVRFLFTAPTNKAAKVLRAIVGEACTIYSALNLRIDKTGELKELVEGKAPDLQSVDIIFIDEASMVNENLMVMLEQYAERFSFRVVFLGDQAQLPPVGELESMIWQRKAEASLTKVVRHDNQILKLVTEIRKAIGSPVPSIKINSNNDGKEGVWKFSKMDFRRSIYGAAAAGEFADGMKSKVIAWRNVRVAEYNDLIRQALFGEDCASGMYVMGERIVAAAPCIGGDGEVLMTTDEEAIVEAVRVRKHPTEPKYFAIELRAMTEGGKTIRLIVMHPHSYVQFQQDSEALAAQAKADGRLWKRFWVHKELFHEIKYAYALTAHRAQGSTYENVWVDYQDILYNRNRQEAFQCLYVACSRPTTRLFLA